MQDSDNLIVGRGNASYKISYEELLMDCLHCTSCPPLQVGKGVITPNSNVKEGDTLQGSATVVDAVNPVVVHCWEQDGVSYENGDNTYVAQVGTIRYRQKVTDDNNVDPVVGEWSDPVVAEEIPPEPDTPNADMHGLRFDSTRTPSQTTLGVGDPSLHLLVWLGPCGRSTSQQ